MPSPLVVKYGEAIARYPESRVLDVPAGYGRNALYLASLGCRVLCVDNDEVALGHIRSQGPAELIHTLRHDVRKQPWPFAPRTFSAALMIDFYDPDLLIRVIESLDTSGLLLCASFGGHGENYLDLPRQGAVCRLIGDSLTVDLMQERAVGPEESACVAFVLVGRKR